MADRAHRRPAGALPAALTSFVGRRRELSEVRRRLADARLLTLTGVGGVGKTRLALEAGRALGPAFPDGVWLVDLAPVTDPASVAPTAATALGVPDQSARPADEQLVDFLAPRHALLLLDNCEHLVDACAHLAESLLSHAPRLRVLATSREPLGIAGEHLYTVPPLSVPAQGGTPLAALSQYDAVDLLVERATAIRPEFQLTEGNRAAVAALVARLDGLPLAIELAASRLRSLTVTDLSDRLDDRLDNHPDAHPHGRPDDRPGDRVDDRFTLLTGGSRTARPRQRTLRALIDWSYELCTPAEQLLWQRLSVFAGGFGLSAAEGVCAGDGLPREAVLDLLDRLVAQSVVLVTEGDKGDEDRPRYRMLETIRQYGRDRLACSGQEPHLRQRHHDHFLTLAEDIAARWCGPGQEAGLARLRADHGNLRAALEWSTAGPTERAPQALALVAALRFHWCADGFLSEGRRWLDRALALSAEPTPARAHTLWVAGWAALLQGDHATAGHRLTESEQLGRALGDPAIVAYVLSFRGTAALFQGRRTEASQWFEQAATAHTATGDVPGTLLALFQRAVAQAHSGDAGAADTGRRAVTLSEERGERWCRSYALWALGHDAWVRGESATAADYTRAALEIQRGFHDYVGAALMLELLAWISASNSEHARAGRLLGVIRSLWRATGSALSVFGPHLADEHARCERTVVSALHADSFERALAEGGRIDHPGQAIAYALDDPTEQTPATASPLTRREQEVADLVAQGMSNRRIAAELVLSPRTVDGHVEHILAKLGFASRTQIATWATARRDPSPDTLA